MPGNQHVIRGPAVSCKALYRVRNWRTYKQALVEGRGRPEEFSDAAIECCLVLRSLFHLPLRATQGFVEGMIQLLDLSIKAPPLHALV